MMWNGWGMMPMTLWGLVILAVLVAAAVLLVRLAPRAGRGGADAAEQVLAARFARGEIDEQEYRTRLATLREHDTSTW